MIVSDVLNCIIFYFESLHHIRLSLFKATKKNFFSVFDVYIFMYILFFNDGKLINILILNNVTKTFIQILTDNFFRFDIDHIFKQINKEIYILKINFFININNII